LALSVGLRTTATPADLWTCQVEGRSFEVDPRPPTIAQYPHSSLKGVKSDLYWIVHAAEDEVLVTLSHRVYAQRDDQIMFIDHRDSVNQTANSMQVVLVAVPAETGSTVFES
jgi:hypothetical protein